MFMIVIRQQRQQNATARGRKEAEKEKEERKEGKKGKKCHLPNIEMSRLIFPFFCKALNYSNYLMFFRRSMRCQHQFPLYRSHFAAAVNAYVSTAFMRTAATAQIVYDATHAQKPVAGWLQGCQTPEHCPLFWDLLLGFLSPSSPFTCGQEFLKSVYFCNLATLSLIIALRINAPSSSAGKGKLRRRRCRRRRRLGAHYMRPARCRFLASLSSQLMPAAPLGYLSDNFSLFLCAHMLLVVVASWQLTPSRCILCSTAACYTCSMQSVQW
jgi:hypothetical protein